MCIQDLTMSDDERVSPDLSKEPHSPCSTTSSPPPQPSILSSHPPPPSSPSRRSPMSHDFDRRSPPLHINTGRHHSPINVPFGRRSPTNLPPISQGGVMPPASGPGDFGGLPVPPPSGVHLGMGLPAVAAVAAAAAPHLPVLRPPPAHKPSPFSISSILGAKDDSKDTKDNNNKDFGDGGGRDRDSASDEELGEDLRRPRDDARDASPLLPPPAAPPRASRDAVVFSLADIYSKFQVYAAAAAATAADSRLQGLPGLQSLQQGLQASAAARSFNQWYPWYHPAAAAMLHGHTLEQYQGRYSVLRFIRFTFSHAGLTIRY